MTTRAYVVLSILESKSGLHIVDRYIWEDRCDKLSRERRGEGRPWWCTDVRKILFLMKTLSQPCSIRLWR
jgi:hypothetical protein